MEPHESEELARLRAPARYVQGRGICEGGVYEVACPRCGRPSGRPCGSAVLGSRKPHQARKDAYADRLRDLTSPEGE
jgi:hypothetical protein